MLPLPQRARRMDPATSSLKAWAELQGQDTGAAGRQPLAAISTHRHNPAGGANCPRPQCTARCLVSLSGLRAAFSWPGLAFLRAQECTSSAAHPAMVTQAPVPSAWTVAMCPPGLSGRRSAWKHQPGQKAATCLLSDASHRQPGTRAPDLRRLPGCSQLEWEVLV